MKFSYISLAVLVLAAFGVRSVMKHQTAGKTPAPVNAGQAHQNDPFALVGDTSAPTDSPSSDPLEEAAYHQQASAFSPSFGPDENTGDGDFLVNI